MRGQGRDAVRHEGPAGPAVFVIFGSTGDLTRRKLVPALYNLKESGLLSDELAVVGVGRQPLDTEGFRAQLREAAGEFIRNDRQSDSDWDEARWRWLEERLTYVEGDFRRPETYRALAETCARLDQERRTGGNYLFYLATPPQFFCEIGEFLGQSGLGIEENGRFRRVIVEKPFGSDLESARALNDRIRQVLHERQIYRIDHYLGKETVQNILFLRFANGIFEPIWNRRYVDHVQITVAEEVGVESRAGYYESAGTLRDMVPNHLFQLLALTAMEPPTSFDADAVRDEKSKVLGAIQPLQPETVLTQVVRGQYGPGTLDGARVAGYREEPGVQPHSRTETFVAMKLYVENWRWAGIPFYLRTGKRLPKRATEIAIQFRSPPLRLFQGMGVGDVPPNTLVLHIQPDEGVSLSFEAKVPGQAVRGGHVRMRFEYADYFGERPSTGYETLLYDALCGDATLFQRADHVEEGWEVVAPVQDVFQALPARDFPNYAAGTWGPAAADDLLKRDGRRWRNR
jgi:glucose-6-phosphate 1-dehydrogenase